MIANPMQTATFILKPYATVASCEADKIKLMEEINKNPPISTEEVSYLIFCEKDLRAQIYSI